MSKGKTIDSITADNIVDVFEEFLETKGFTVEDFPNQERDEYIEHNDTDIFSERLIFGTDRKNMIEEIKTWFIWEKDNENVKLRKRQ